MKTKISAVIMTKNEEKNIERCLKSVKFCDQIIIVDDFSENKTIEKVHKVLKVHKAYKVLQRRLNGNFAGQRNFAMEKAKNNWVLFIDADEEVSDELRNEIVSLFHDFTGSKISAYSIKRRDFWWGRELKYGETKKIRDLGIIRLIKKNSGKWIGKVHEEFKTDKLIGQFKSFFNHYPHPSIKNFLDNVNFYSTLRAKELYNQGIKTNIFEILFYPSGKFLLSYFIKLGILDGPPGFAYSFFMSFHSFLVRVKLYQFGRFRHSALASPIEADRRSWDAQSI